MCFYHPEAMQCFLKGHLIMNCDTLVLFIKFISCPVSWELGNVTGAAFPEKRVMQKQKYSVNKNHSLL